MLVALSVYLIAILFAWLESSKIVKNGLKYSFYAIFLFLALRYNFGNDYMGYLNQFMQIRSNKDIEYFHFRYSEFGWWYLNYFFTFFGSRGFFLMYAIIAAFTSFVGYRFIKKYIPVQYYTIAVFLYVFQPDNILTLSSGIRQYIAVSFFILSLDFLIKREYLKYLLFILLASLFHTSSLFFVLLIFLNIVDWKVKPIYIILFFLAFVTLINFQAELFIQLDEFTKLYFEEYSAYTKSGFEKVSLGLGFLLNSSLYLFILFIGLNKNDKQSELFIKIGIVSLLFLALNLAVNMATRLTFYIYPAMIVAIIWTLVYLKTKPLYRMGFNAAIIVFTLYQFYLFWNSPVYGPHFEKYQTIFSTPYF